ncbi:hypothetical protein B0T26DRAFT_775332 [Lasiosphaeria miniovina]|uniref:DUF8021 domain-containing protein n=1 Tax=Lasiosphaeria miniovina TaxID=1954250 RepID=A0AA40DY37_9PEZI|nr:uncharacterized protein B0T26DRAFT_775332 [Lasiosphaeria miniovina]KAK0717276.1 hypothetical protein B0T26DRAFT_775332 [Lasiosphaeria miniovina]
MKAQILVLASTSLALGVAADCSREFLVNATNKYIAAQTTGNVGIFAALASSNLSYTESEIPVDIAKGVLSRPMKINHSRSLHDTVGCATFTELIVTDPVAPYVIGTRMIFADGKASLVETIATKPGDWAFNATGYLYWDSIEKWDPIPAEKRDSRAAIKAAGDAYFERFHNSSFVVPWGTPCARLEGGAYTGRGNLSANTCDLGLPSTLVVTDRRYVIDEGLGAVDIFLGFPGLDRSVGQQPMPDSHVFRVEGGKIRYIHTVSTCVHAGCGMNGTAIPQRRRL